MIEFYGSPASSSGRTHWMLEETAVPYTYRRVVLRDPAQPVPEAVAANGGKVPVLIDGELTLNESMAINFYLAERYAPALWAADLTQRASLYRWSFWAISSLQPELLTLMWRAMQRPVGPAPERVESAQREAARMLGFLEHALTGREYLLDRGFSVADVNVGSVVNLARATGVLTDAYPQTRAWLDKLRERPAYQRAARA
ncbi:MAG TPA: glutathione S-transferase family protein [Polyangiales bacterium]|nr:glutathione S-transferase family protein [Polyangiales bacterium]